MGFAGALWTLEFCFVVPETPSVVPVGAACFGPFAVLVGFDLVEDVVILELPLLNMVDGALDGAVDAVDDLLVPFDLFEA